MSKIDDYKTSSKILESIDSNKDQYLLIHYSCQSFYDNENSYSRKITSIAVRKLSDGQTDLFAVHRSAEILKIVSNDISSQYDKIEKHMLTEFYDFVERNSNKYWIHWNMRDHNYGFKAIEHRFKVLQGHPVIIPDDNKIDLSRLLIQKYGNGYIKHPRLEKLMQKNEISKKDFLTGSQEAAAFENEEYIALSRSSASKVDLFANILTLEFNNILKTRASKKDMYGNSIKSWIHVFFSSRTGKVIIWILANIISGIIGYGVGQILG